MRISQQTPASDRSFYSLSPNAVQSPAATPTTQNNMNIFHITCATDGRTTLTMNEWNEWSVNWIIESGRCAYGQLRSNRLPERGRVFCRPVFAGGRHSKTIPNQHYLLQSHLLIRILQKLNTILIHFKVLQWPFLTIIHTHCNHSWCPRIVASWKSIDWLIGWLNATHRF